MPQMLLQNAIAILSENATVITNSANFITKYSVYYKLRQHKHQKHSKSIKKKSILISCSFNLLF